MRNLSPFPFLALTPAVLLFLPWPAVGPWPDAPEDVAQEPPLEWRVTVGDEVVRCAEGRPGALADGTRVTVEVLPHRRFEAPGVFAFDYPRAWEFSAAGTESGRWWNLRGDGVSIHMRHFFRDADTVARDYVDNLERGDGTGRRAVTRSFGGREIEGEAIRTPSYSIGGRSPWQAWEQEVYGIPDGAGGVWQVVLHRGIARPTDWVGAVELVLVDGEARVASGESRPAPVDPRAAALEALSAAWIWR